MGYVAKAVIYAGVGTIALLAALRTGEHTIGLQETLLKTLHQPSGKWLLGILAVGLGAYAIWRFVQAWADTDRHGTRPMGIMLRLGAVFAGMVYAGLALSAIRLLIGERAGPSEDQKAKSITASLMAEPYGDYLVAAIGIGFIAFALRRLYLSCKELFEGKLKLQEMTRGERILAIVCGRLGSAARAAVLGFIGCFLIKASIHRNPGEARGLGGVLRALEHESFGRWILGAIALGFVAYALYLMLLVPYRRIVHD
jgi:hypothetical protein